MSATSVAWNKNVKNIRLIQKIAAYVFLIIGGFIMAIPFFWMLSTSLKPEGAVFTMPPQWIPEKFVWENYWTVLTEANLLRGFMNTFAVIIPPTVIGVFTSSLAAFGFSKLKFPGRDKLFLVLLATIMLPGVVTMVPTFIIFRDLGWLDTWMPLIIPGMFGTAMAIFFLRQFFMTIPDELMEAAKIDGLGYFGIFIRIILPLAKPAIVTQAILWFLAGYNDFLGPLIYINTPEKFTLQLVLASFNGYYTSEWTLIMAGSVLALIPTILMFFFAQKQFIEGITMTGIKG
ncbi:carbohydrate ABC transporter permease [Metabacillus halosaccharovorans]|uniref:Carbohydrate ABC transporter permease n=1 Tax=Metabacillus halosaccharovorans TaxID=930124 RepID=A0ABT3DH38_9BACI|nr:carbohydrate ABC transporter permease [Metabacillus halosaccharovorans]MCV9886370.1 carbohydrate ABC transporter permease [Metabacillus halosaccharovorans]